MSDMISRLKLESGEFDSKVKRAVTGIQRMAQECHAAGGELTYLEDENRDFIKSLGSMETVAQSARGKLSELTAGFTDLKQIYNALSDEEKKGEFGQELNKQLDIMKGRITDAKQELNDINKELGNTGKEAKSTGGFMQQLSDKFVVNIDAMKVFDLACKAGSAVLGVLKDAFMSNETNVDEWGRTMEAASALYDGFVIALNNGDFSTYLSNISKIKEAAKEAYNALDELRTVATIQSPERAKLQARQTELQSIIRLKGKNSSEGQAAQKELLAMQPKLRASYASESRMNKTYFQKKVMEKLAESGITLGKHDLAVLMSSFENEDIYRKMQANRSGAIYTRYEGTDRTNARIRTVDTRNINAKLLDLFTDEWRQENSPYLTASYNALSSSFANDRSLARYLNGGGGRGGGGRTPYVAQTQVINMGEAWTTPFSGNATATLGGLQGGIEMFDFSQSMKDLSDTIKQRGGIAWTNKTNEQIFEDWSKEFNSMTGGITNIAKGIESMGIEIPSALKKGLSILNTISTVLGIIQSIMTISEAANKFMQITQVGMAIATHGAVGVHNGGIIRAAGGYTVPGNYGFDAVPALLTSGELVLNRAQQSRLAGVLRDRAQSGGTGSVRISGEDIYIAVSNFMQRRGYGEIAVGR